MRARDAVISRPTNVPLLRRGFFATLTLAAWSLFAWLLTPLLTLALWAFGLVTAYDEGIARIGAVDPRLLIGVACASAALAGLLLLWAQIQRRRFQGVERRRRITDVPADEVARFLGATPDVAEVLQTARIVVLEMDDDGRPVGAAPLSAMQALGRHAGAPRAVVPTQRTGPDRKGGQKADTRAGLRVLSWLSRAQRR